MVCCARSHAAIDPRPERGLAGALRANRGWAVGLLAAGLILRLVHVATVRDSPLFQYLVLDPRMYDEWAQRILAGDWLGDRPFFQDPLYAYALAALYAVAGHGYVAVAIVQGVLGALVAPLVLVAAATSFDRTTARVAGVIAVLYLPAVFYDGLVEKTSLTVFLVALHLALLAAALVEPKRTRLWLAVGLVLGLAVLNRGNLLLWAPVLAIGSSLHVPRGERPWRALAAFLIGCALVVGAATVRNRVAGGEWVLSTSNFGQNLYIGNNPRNTSGQYARLPFVEPNPKHEERNFAQEAQRRAGRELDANETSRFWAAEALRFMTHEPGAWLRLTWTKVRVYFGAYEVPDSVDYYLFRETAPLLRLPLPGFGLVAPLGLVGLCLALWNRGYPRALALFVLTYSATVIAFFVFSRFRMIAMPGLYVLAAHGGVELVRRARRAMENRQARGPAWRLVACTLLALAFVNLPVRGPVESWSMRLAAATRLPHRPESAASGHFNLGVTYAAEAKEAADPKPLLERAEQELRRALAGEGRFAELHVELGKVLARQGREREAIEEYERAAALEPMNFLHRHALGLLHGRTGETAAAEAAFRQALALEPRHLASSLELGELLLATGRSEEAERVYARALALAPGNVAATRGLERARGE